MTPARLAECLDLLGWSARYLARCLGCSESYVRERWMPGGKRPQPIPQSVDDWVEALTAAHAALPAPEWRRAA